MYGLATRVLPVYSDPHFVTQRQILADHRDAPVVAFVFATQLMKRDLKVRRTVQPPWSTPTRRVRPLRPKSSLSRTTATPQLSTRSSLKPLAVRQAVT